MRKIFVLLMLAFAGHLGAQTYEYQPAFGNLGWYPSAQAACNAAQASNNAQCGPGLPASYRVDTVVADSQGASCYIGAQGGCNPSTASTPVDYMWIYLSKRVTTTPPLNVCTLQANERMTVRTSLGWAKSNVPNTLDHVGKLYNPVDDAVGTKYCHSRCETTLGSFGKNFRSQFAAPNGLYRLSQDIEFVATGVTCDASPVPQPAGPQFDPQQTPLPCPGYLGEVNGVSKCIPREGTSFPPPMGQPPEGEPVSGNPTAGPKPPSGPGSGVGGEDVTPQLGNGTAMGGPRSGPGGSPPPTVPNGTTPKPAEGEEQQACGAPGQPQCKIDETGTPTDKALTADIPKLKGEADEGRSKIAGTQDKGFLSTYTALFDAPPFVACTPFDLPNNYGSLDICGHGDTFRAVAAVLWALGGFWWSFSLIREVF